MKYHYLDLKNWSRQKQFNFFKKYQNPFFNMCTVIDVSALLAHSKLHNQSFSMNMLFASIVVANEVEEFKYRLKGEGVIVCDQIYAGSTILMEDDTFNFCYFNFTKSHNQFIEQYKQEIKLINSQNQDFDPRNNDINIIHYSVIPWISFTSFSHPRNYSTNDSIPKIVFGKYYQDNGKTLMPISIEVHHALMDGYHMGKYLNKLQEFIDPPSFI